MNIKKNYNGKELTIEVGDRIDTVTAPDFENEIMDEMGRVLIATQKKLKPENIPMVIKNVNDTINEIFKMSGFDKILKIE